MQFSRQCLIAINRVKTYREASHQSEYGDECLMSLMYWSLFRKHCKHEAFHLIIEIRDKRKPIN